MKTKSDFMRLIKMGLILITFTVAVQFQQVASAQTLLKSSVFSNGGADISGSSHRIIGTVGQSGIGETSNTINKHWAGFWYQAWDFMTSLEQIPDNLPRGYRLEQNYPNPFNQNTTIEFTIPKPSFVTLKIYNVSGKAVATLVSEKLQPGHHNRVWSAPNISNGVYYYRLQVGDFTAVRKLLIINMK